MEGGLTTKASSADRIGDIVWPKVLVPVKLRSVGGRGDKFQINNNATGKEEDAGWLATFSGSSRGWGGDAERVGEEKSGSRRKCIIY